MSCPQQTDKVALEIGAEVRNVFPRVFADDRHLPYMCLRLDVTLKAVGVATLLLARLAPPAQALQTPTLHLISYPFCAAYFGLGHLCGLCDFLGSWEGWRSWKVSAEV
jgi:hypothetical protein